MSVKPLFTALLATAVIGVFGLVGLIVLNPLGIEAPVPPPEQSSGPVCGNGRIEDGEVCDDENPWFGDGCTKCQLEVGFVCTGEPSVCGPGIPPSCGDGKVEEELEECDDGNTADGDGCTGRCTEEQGYKCEGTTSTCIQWQCGNGRIDGNEACDDGNAGSGDGCNSACLIEKDYSCLGQPSKCTGKPEPDPVPVSSTTPQQVSSTPVHQAAPVTPATPAPVVSASSSSTASVAAAPKKTSTNNSAAASSATSRFRPRDRESIPTYAGSAYSSSIQYERLRCGDGLVTEGETCDDGNVKNGDGCSAGCVLETGFQCYGQPSSCAIQCGDGVVASGESCDDGNGSDGDGCSSICKLEFGFSCSGSPSSCHSLAYSSSSSSN